MSADDTSSEIPKPSASSAASDPSTAAAAAPASHSLGAVYKYKWIDCQDEYGKWYEAQITQVDKSSNSKSDTSEEPSEATTRIRVHYKGWKSKFDTWLDLTSNMDRLEPLHTHTARPDFACPAAPSLSIGGTCDCLDSTDKWFEAEITDMRNTPEDARQLIRIHYQGWDKKYDEWMHTDSYRIAPLHSMTSKLPSQRTTVSNTIASNSNKRKLEQIPLEQQQQQKEHTIPCVEDPIPIENAVSTEHKQQTTPNAARIAINPATTTSSEASISAEQRVRHRQIQQRYLSNFKPSVRDERQFANKLAQHKLRIVSMGEDGNCLFRSMAHQVYGNEAHHMLLRAKCVAYLESEHEYFASYIANGHNKDAYAAYCVRMSHSGVWGDNLEIQVFSEMYGRSIEIYAYDDKPMSTFCNDSPRPGGGDTSVSRKTPLRLSYHCNSHYNSIVDGSEGDEWKGLMDESKVGEIEDEKIRLSYLRSTQARQTTMAMSDLEATELACFESALQESRKLFDGSKSTVFDEVIEESLRQLEQQDKDNVENAVLISMKDQERRDLELALKKSQYDFGVDDGFAVRQVDVNGNVVEEEEEDDGIQGIDTEVTDGARVIKRVVDKGYSLEQATLAWSVFEAQRSVGEARLVQRMVEYIENAQKASMFGYGGAGMFSL